METGLNRFAGAKNAIPVGIEGIIPTPLAMQARASEAYLELIQAVQGMLALGTGRAAEEVVGERSISIGTL